MILLQLFYTFLLIGLFTFGGGYSMIALIQDQVVVQHAWLTAEEFTDLLAISQVTPGPVGINTATYAGYSAVIAEGYPTAMAVIGALIASLAVLILPLTLILIVGHWLLMHKDEAPINRIFPILRLTVIGLIAAAAISLMPSAFVPVTNGPDTLSIFNFQFSIYSILIFLAVFLLSLMSQRHKDLKTPTHLSTFSSHFSPFTLLLLSGLAGALLYGI
ncbi:MAG: chromate transporter [bacterium]